MIDEVNRLTDTMPRVEAFLLQHADKCPKDKLEGRLSEDLLTQTRLLPAAVLKYTSGNHGVDTATVSRQEARERLHTWMTAIARTAIAQR